MTKFMDWVRLCFVGYLYCFCDLVEFASETFVLRLNSFAGDIVRTWN